MKIKFTKMHGLGNDFIVVDLRKKNIRNLSAIVRKLSDRRFGIGFDQALVLKNSKKADFKMDIYNGDGGRVEMCGNGVRCLARYVWTRALSKKKTLEIETLAGIIRPKAAKAGLVTVDMGRAVLEGKLIPALKSGEIKELPLKILDRVFKITCVSMGNPHCVIFLKDVKNFPVEKYGPPIETHPFFPKRTNVEFIKVINRGKIEMRVWERGAGETPACGTGACAAAVASNLLGYTGRKVEVVLKGGSLRVEWAKDLRVYMTGPAVEVFEGAAKL